MAKFRVEYTIQRVADDQDDWADIGFGSSDSWGSIAEALYEAQSAIENRQWETSDGMPDPNDAEAVSGGE